MDIVKELLHKTAVNMVTIVQSTFKTVLWFILSWIILMMLCSAAGIVIRGLHLEFNSNLLAWLIIAVLAIVCGFLAYFIVQQPLFDWKRNIFGNDGRSETEQLFDDISLTDILARVLAVVILAGIVVAAVLLVLLDTSLLRSLMGSATLALQAASRYAGQDWRAVLVALLWLMDGLCLATSLLLILPIMLRRTGVSGHVYRVSGIACVLSYTASMAASEFSFFLQLAGRSPLSQYTWLHDSVQQEVSLYGHSTAYVVLHTYMLLPLAAIVLNIILFKVLWRSYRRSQAEALLEEEGGYDASLYQFNSDDVECFRFLTLSVTGKLGAWRDQESKLVMLFYAYNPQIVSQFTDEEIRDILQNDCGIHSRNRLRDVIGNARQFFAISQTYGSFRGYVESTINANVVKMPASELEAKAILLANDLRRRGFRQIGPVTAEYLLEHMRKHPAMPQKQKTAVAGDNAAKEEKCEKTDQTTTSDTGAGLPVA